VTSARSEWTGVGAALLFHIALIAAMSLSLAQLDREPEPPSMQVDIVDEVAFETAAPQAVAETGSPPPKPIEAVAEPDQVEPVAPAPPTPRAVPQPAIQPTPPVPRQPTRTAPRTPPKVAAKPTRRAGLGEDFLSELDDDLSPRAGSSKPAAPTYNATARASIGSSIAAQAQRCANREPFIGEGADQVRLTINLQFARSGRLSRPPRVTAMSGNADLRAKYGELLEDQVRRIFTDCAPFRLPADLYDTDNGGWRDTTINYRVKK
jgi:outer membrane biosynthesis protein TonB